MNRIFLLLLVPVMLLTTGCPVDVPYPLGDKGNEKMDKSLIGTWVQHDTSMEVMRLEIIELDKYTVQLTVLERGANYMEEVDVFKGWTTELDGKKFVYFQDASNPDAGYYTYCYNTDGKTMYTYDVSLLIGGVDAVTSTEAYRKEVSESLKLPDALSSEAEWIKE